MSPEGEERLSAKVAAIEADVRWIKRSLETGEAALVSKAEFEPVRRIVYGGFAVIATAILATLLQGAGLG